MREASKTGGALGAINTRELELLQSDYGSLAQSQSKEQFIENMERMRNDYLDVIHGPPTKVTTPEEAAQLPSGTRILLPDGTIGHVP
jgi:hypothetical protein